MDEIEDLLRTGRRDLLIRHVAPAPYGEGRLSGANVQELIETLQNASDRRWKERAFAAWALGQAQDKLSPEQREKAGRALRDALQDRQSPVDERVLTRCARAWWSTYRTLLTIVLVYGGCVFASAWLEKLSVGGVFTAFDLLSKAVAGGGLLTLFLSFLASAVVMPLSLWLAANRSNRVRAAAATALGRLRWPASVGALAKETLDKREPIRHAAETSLKAVLPTLTPDHYGRLGPDAVPDLCALIENRLERWIATGQRIIPGIWIATEEQFAMEILGALEKIGDSRALPTVRRVASRARTPRMEETAARLLLILEERQYQEESRAMLLRGASMPSAAPDTLLRPAAANAADVAPERLLRAADAAGGDA